LPVFGNVAGSMTSASGELVLDLLDAALDETLLLARGVVLGVLGQVAVARASAMALMMLGRASDLSFFSSARSASAPRSVMGVRFMRQRLPMQVCRRFTSTSSR
jgi:hypothetical protein